MERGLLSECECGHTMGGHYDMGSCSFKGCECDGFKLAAPFVLTDAPHKSKGGLVAAYPIVHTKPPTPECGSCGMPVDADEFESAHETIARLSAELAKERAGLAQIKETLNETNVRHAAELRGCAEDYAEIQNVLRATMADLAKAESEIAALKAGRHG